MAKKHKFSKRQKERAEAIAARNKARIEAGVTYKSGYHSSKSVRHNDGKRGKFS